MKPDIDRIIAVCRHDSRCVSGSERRALCDEIERLRRWGHETETAMLQAQAKVVELRKLVEKAKLEAKQ